MRAHPLKRKHSSPGTYAIDVLRHLHCHTDYSLRDGACDIDQLMKIAVEQKMLAVAMTDHGNLFGGVLLHLRGTNMVKRARHRIESLQWRHYPGDIILC